MPEIDSELIRVALRKVTLETDYLERVVNDAWRHALNGERIDQIPLSQRAAASGVLALREVWEWEKR